MGRFLIILSTIVAITALFMNKENNKRVITSIHELFREINYTYINLFREKSKVTRWLQGTFFIVAEIMTIIGAIAAAIGNMGIDITGKNFIIPLIIIFILLGVHLAIGYVLLVLTNIQLFINKLENRNLKTELLISYFIISTYFFTLIMFPDEFESSYIVGLIGLSVSYYLNMKVLIKLIRNPKEVLNNKKCVIRKERKMNRIVIASILLLIMIILNLFLAVNLINSAIPGSFSNNPSSFDLFYYTIITFATVGYGDIVPLTIAGKIISIIICITSVVCLTVFLSSVLSSAETK